MRLRILSLPGEAIQSDRQSRDSYALKPVQLQMSHPSASQWVSPLNLAFPVLNDHEQVAHWTADTLRVAIVTPQTRYLAGRLTCCSVLLANFKRMCVSLQLGGNYDSRIYRDWQKGPTVVERLSTDVGAAQQEDRIPPPAGDPAAFTESFLPHKPILNKGSTHHHIASLWKTCLDQISDVQKQSSYWV